MVYNECCTDIQNLAVTNAVRLVLLALEENVVVAFDEMKIHEDLVLVYCLRWGVLLGKKTGRRPAGGGRPPLACSFKTFILISCACVCLFYLIVARNITKSLMIFMELLLQI